MVLAAQYDQVHIIGWQPLWVILPLLLHDSGRQVVSVAAASYAASFRRQWPMMSGKRHDKIVQRHHKVTSPKGDGRGKKFPVFGMDDGRGRTVFSI